MSFDLIPMLRQGRWRNGVDIRAIQQTEGFEGVMINDIIRLSQGEGCKRGYARLQYGWDYGNMMVYALDRGEK